jgi:hypothetical protein
MRLYNEILFEEAGISSDRTCRDKLATLGGLDRLAIERFAKGLSKLYPGHLMQIEGEEAESDQFPIIRIPLSWFEDRSTNCDK